MSNSKISPEINSKNEKLDNSTITTIDNYQEPKNEYIKEKGLVGYPEIVSYERTLKIVKQMEKNICNIVLIDCDLGTGFFCKIPFPDRKNMLPVLITNNHVIDEKLLNSKNAYITLLIRKLKENAKPINKTLYLKDRLTYTDPFYDITIIELKEEKDNIKDYLELDDNIFADIEHKEDSNNSESRDNSNNNDIRDYNNLYRNKSIYIIQYPEGDLSVSYGTLSNKKKNQENYVFNHLCSTRSGSSGSPILSLMTNKVIGIHKGNDNSYNYNEGTFLNYPIKAFILEKMSEYINKINNEEKLKEVNKKIQLLKLKNFKNINSDDKEIDLMNKNIGISIFKSLCDIEFKELIELKFRNNNICNIEPLKNARFCNLQTLGLTDNKIGDITVLKDVNFKNLKKLYLGKNNISDINILQEVDFKELQLLHLQENKISNIEVLEKVNFKKLKDLKLFNNSISDINILGKVKFDELKILNLGKNEINDINIFNDAKFVKLEILNLQNNKITSLDNLDLKKYINIKSLYLNGNKDLKYKTHPVIQNLKKNKPDFNCP